MPRPARSSTLALALALSVAACSDSSGPDGVFGCDSVARYQIGETVNGSIRPTDCTDPDELSHVDFYQFRQSAAGPVSIVLELPQGSVRMFVALIDSNEDLVDARDVEPGDEESVGGFLDAGSYIIAIGAETPGTQSTYTLSSERSTRFSGPAFLNCTVAQAYTIGATVNGTLATGDCVTPDEGWMDRYQFTVAATRTVRIDLASEEFDAFLYLFDSDGVILARNDDGGNVFDSRITISLPPGTYSIGAATFEGEGGGAYTLTTQ